VEILVVVLAIAQGSFGGHFTQRRGWERYMDLELDLVQKEDEEVEEGVGLSREQRSAPWSKVEKERKKLNFKKWEGFMLLTRL
jgi:hypothetical protein